jgi:hypothetical protein
VRGLYSVARKPVVMREGMPMERNITARAEAKYSQCPSLVSKRKAESGCSLRERLVLRL